MKTLNSKQNLIALIIMYLYTSIGSCLAPPWVGDGICDGVTNTPECDFDGKDCCQPENVLSDISCNNCECLEGI